MKQSTKKRQGTETEKIKCSFILIWSDPMCTRHLLNSRLMFTLPLQGDVGHPGETGDPGPKGEKVSLL